jgi:hypothetical protein
MAVPKAQQLEENDRKKRKKSAAHYKFAENNSMKTAEVWVFPPAGFKGSRL